MTNIKFQAASISPTFQTAAIVNGCLCLKVWSFLPENNKLAFGMSVYSSSASCDAGDSQINIKIANGDVFMSSFSLDITDTEITNGLTLTVVKQKLIDYLSGVDMLNTTITAL